MIFSLRLVRIKEFLLREDNIATYTPSINASLVYFNYHPLVKNELVYIRVYNGNMTLSNIMGDNEITLIEMSDNIITFTPKNLCIGNLYIVEL